MYISLGHVHSWRTTSLKHWVCRCMKLFSNSCALGASTEPAPQSPSPAPTTSHMLPHAARQMINKHARVHWNQLQCVHLYHQSFKLATSPIEDGGGYRSLGSLFNKQVKQTHWFSASAAWTNNSGPSRNWLELHKCWSFESTTFKLQR